MNVFLVLQTILAHFLLLVLFGISMFGNSTIGFLLLITHILACITVGIVFRFWKRNYTSSSSNLFIKNSKSFKSKKTISCSDLGAIVGESITNSISTILTIGGFVVLFSVIISILQNSHFMDLFKIVFNFLNIPTNIANSTLLGMIEITNGIASISAIPMKKISINIIITAFLLGSGGISILLQVWSIVAKTDLSIKPYILGKLLHGTLAALYTFIFIKFFPFFYFDL